MFERFFSRSVKYQEKQLTIQTKFARPVLPVKQSVQAVLKAQNDLEKDLQHAGKKTSLREQQNAPEYMKHTVDIARALNKSLKDISLMYSQRNLEEIALTQSPNGITRELFETIYRSNTELLSSEFLHVSSLQLDRLKEKLIDDLQNFLISLHHDNYVGAFPRIKNKLKECQRVICQTMDLIYSAKTVSAVMATIVVQADLLAQMQLLGSLSDNSWKSKAKQVKQAFQDKAFISPVTLFKEVLPQTLQDYRLGLGTKPNARGSAFQLEAIREKLIGKLEQYLQSRARYDGEIADENHIVTKKYTPIDRGFFYNKNLQDAHIEVAALLLTQLEHMQLKEGTRIDNPQLFAQVLMKAYTANIKNNRTLARAGIDGTGNLFALLNDTCIELGDIYQNQNIHFGKGDDLRQQLGLEQTSPAIGLL